MPRALSLKTFLVSVLLTAAAHAEPVAFHFSGTIDTSLSGDGANEFDFAPIPNGSVFSGCLSYETDTTPTSTALSPEGDLAIYDPLTSTELAIETAAGTFSGTAANSFAVVFTGLNYNGLYAASQPDLFPAGWSDDGWSYLSVLLRNPRGSTEPLSSLELPTSIDLESVSARSVVFEFQTGVTYPGGTMTRAFQVWGDIQAGAWSSGTCGAVDTDGDGLLDPDDACPNSAELPVDETGCSVSDLVPCDGEYSSKGAYVTAVTAVARAFFERGLLTRDEFADVVKRAAKSNCGG
jgi:hypothetical protein